MRFLCWRTLITEAIFSGCETSRENVDIPSQARQKGQENNEHSSLSFWRRRANGVPSSLWNHCAFEMMTHRDRRWLYQRVSWWYGYVSYQSVIPFCLQKPVSRDPYKAFCRASFCRYFFGVTLVFVVRRSFCRNFCLAQKRCSNCMSPEVGSPGKPRSSL